MSKILKPLPYYKYSFYNELVVVNVMESNHIRCPSATSSIITIHSPFKKMRDIGVEPMTLPMKNRDAHQPI
jgi:hypothetical protein